MNPYEILGITNEPDDASVRSAYLELVRRYPPERFPDKFREINSAYNELKDEKSRLKYYIFNEDPGIKSPFEALQAHFINKKRTPPGLEKMKEYLKKCATL